MNKHVPQDMRQHLMLHQSCLSTAEEVVQEIKDYWDVTKELTRDDKSWPHEKVENLMECHTTLERVERRAKENAQRTRIPTRAW